MLFEKVLHFLILQYTVKKFIHLKRIIFKMSFLNIESLDDEIKELLDNYKSKKATIHEPCTLKNFKECVIGLSEVELFYIIM